MPHACRLDGPGTIHHVMSHTVEGCPAFSEDRCRTDFVVRLRKAVEKGQLRIHAWALMTNHYHLVAEPVQASLSSSIHQLLTGFACTYNAMHDRRGHVFDARFRSILVEEERYFLRLLAYVHLNPLRAGLVGSIEELDTYPWTGHPAMMGKDADTWLSTELAVSRLSSAPKSWRENYMDLLVADAERDSGELDCGSFSLGPKGLRDLRSAPSRASNERSIRVLGSKRFALKQYELYREARRTGLRLRQQQHLDIESQLLDVAREFHLSAALLRSGSRGETISAARRQLICRLVEDHGLTQADAASYLGISQAAVSQALRRARTSSQD